MEDTPKSQVYISNFFVSYDKASKKYHRKTGGPRKKEKKGEAIGHATPYLTQEYSHFLTSPILYGFLLLYGYGTNRNIGFVKL